MCVQKRDLHYTNFEYTTERAMMMHRPGSRPQ